MPRDRTASTPSTARRRRCSTSRCRSAQARSFALLGPNGAGKTTTLRSILGLTRPRRGRDQLRRANHRRGRRIAIARAGVGWVPDDRRICPTLTSPRTWRIAIKRTRYRPWSLSEIIDIFSRTRIPDGTRGREPVGRRDADGGDRPGTSGLARSGAVRRAEPGPRAQDRRRCDGDDASPQARRHRRRIVVEQNAELALSVADRVVVLSHGTVAWTGEAAVLRPIRRCSARLLGGAQ